MRRRRMGAAQEPQNSFAFTETRQPDPRAGAPGYGPTRWRPLPGYVSHPEQVGRYGEDRLNFVPGIWPGIQRDCGLINTDLLVKTPSDLPIWQQSQYPSAAPQAQRFGHTFTGPSGPISSLSLSQRIADGQVAQSGLRAVQFSTALAVA